MQYSYPNLKACPVVTRKTQHGELEVLAFKHPLAGLQLVKGTIEEGEQPDLAALRELGEESGTTHAEIVRPLGIVEVGPPHQLWFVFECKATDLAEHWTFLTHNDGGLEFQFFWHQLNAPTDESWHLIFRQAMTHIRGRLAV